MVIFEQQVQNLCLRKDTVRDALAHFHGEQQRQSSSSDEPHPYLQEVGDREDPLAFGERFENFRHCSGSPSKFPEPRCLWGVRGTNDRGLELSTTNSFNEVNP